jgi:hypothetical protein
MNHKIKKSAHNRHNDCSNNVRMYFYGGLMSSKQVIGAIFCLFIATNSVFAAEYVSYPTCDSTPCHDGVYSRGSATKNLKSAFNAGHLIGADNSLNFAMITYLQDVTLVSKGNQRSGSRFQFTGDAYIAGGAVTPMRTVGELGDLNTLQRILPENVLDLRSSDGRSTYKRLAYPFTPFCEHTNSTFMDANVRQIKVAAKGQSVVITDAKAWRFDAENNNSSDQVLKLKGWLTTNDPVIEKINIDCYAAVSGPVSTAALKDILSEIFKDVATVE